MSTYKLAPHFKSFNGRSGELVLSTWKNLLIGKARPGKNKNRKVSDKQRNQRDLFAVVSQFIFRISKSVIDRAYQLGRKENITAYNAAMSYHMLKAVRWEDSQYVLSLPEMKFSRPLLEIENGWELDFYRDLDGRLAVKGGMNPFPDKFTQPDDEATIIFYNTTMNRFLVYSKMRRDSLNFQLGHLKNFEGLEFFCWIFFMSADTKRVSATKYLGMLNM